MKKVGFKRYCRIMKKRFKNLFLNLLYDYGADASKMFFLLVVAIILQKLGNFYAEKVRGYSAMGGEIFIFPAVMLLGLLFLFYIPMWLDYEDCEEDVYEDDIE